MIYFSKLRLQHNGAFKYFITLSMLISEWKNFYISNFIHVCVSFLKRVIKKNSSPFAFWIFFTSWLWADKTKQEETFSKHAHDLSKNFVPFGRNKNRYFKVFFRMLYTFIMKLNWKCYHEETFHLRKHSYSSCYRALDTSVCNFLNINFD